MIQNSQPNNPLHGIKLADILTELIENLGWEEMEKETNIKCFGNNPTYKSSLKFLRTMPWARKRTEELYLEWLEYKELHNL